MKQEKNWKLVGEMNFKKEKTAQLINKMKLKQCKDTYRAFIDKNNSICEE
jgi:hypothetical protein